MGVKSQQYATYAAKDLPHELEKAPLRGFFFYNFVKVQVQVLIIDHDDG